jgi:hypothetical protein
LNPTKGFLGRLNYKFKNLIPFSYSVIIPIFYYYEDINEFSKEIKEKLNKQIKFYKSKKYYLSDLNVVSIGYESIKRRN